jgi:hypothetical protein
VQTVRGIAATRFDWNASLANLARVVPANTSLESLTGTVVPGASAGGSAGSGGGSSGATNLRGDITGPAFELNGCTASQDDVARLISRLRVMPGVKRVALGSSVIEQQSQSSAASARGCKPGSPTFSLVVFFNQVAGAGATGATTLTAAPSAPGATATPTATAPATSGGGAQ